MSLLRAILVLVAALPMITAQARAADLAGTSYQTTTDENGVTFTIAPFNVWIPGMKGTVGVLGTTASVDITPRDILSNLSGFVDVLDGLYIGSGEIRYRKFGFLYDIYYMKMSVDERFNRRFISGGLEFGFRQSTTTLAGTYRVMETAKSHVDAIAGVRIWDIKADLGVDINRFAFFRSDGDRWVDGIVGFKGRTMIAPRWSLAGWAMIGAGGSDLTWDLYGGINYEVHKGFDLLLGFRAMSTDYSDDDFVWDMRQYGPVVSATFKF